ncbi:hypothetical protein BV20DRAFT_1045644 [Pilatotrama ljubarskyi]|nr:hypothetical protein BV20DRAFT_1045644 [Pilatotrama ljubarskyi]
MYVRTPSTGGSQLSSVSDAPSTPSQAPRSLKYDGFPSTPRTPATPLSPYTPGSPGHYAPFAPPLYGGNHNVAHGLMTPPDSPDKIGRGQSDFHSMLDARTNPVSFDLRTGMLLHAQTANQPAINHSVNRMVISIGGFFDVEIVSRSVPTMGELMQKLAQAMCVPTHPRAPGASRASLLGSKCFFAGLTLRSLERGTAVCMLHLRNGR